MTPWLEILYPTSSPLAAAREGEAKSSEMLTPSRFASPPPMDDEPRRAGTGDTSSRKSQDASSAEMPTSSYLFCVTCKRTLVPGALYADGWEDTEALCHVHNQEQADRNFDAMLKRAGKATGWDRESTERRYGQ